LVSGDKWVKRGMIFRIEYLIEYLTEGGAADIENIRTKERKYKTGGE